MLSHSSRRCRCHTAQAVPLYVPSTGVTLSSTLVQEHDDMQPISTLVTDNPVQNHTCAQASIIQAALKPAMHTGPSAATATAEHVTLGATPADPAGAPCCSPTAVLCSRFLLQMQHVIFQSSWLAPLLPLKVGTVSAAVAARSDVVAACRCCCFAASVTARGAAVRGWPLQQAAQAAHTRSVACTVVH